jgi:sec-independent protein translocase protein TatA
MDIGPPELLILALLVLVVFGGSRIPMLARNLGKAQSEFKKGLSGEPDEPATVDAPSDQTSV